MKKYQQIIWDWNGTILDDTHVAFGCICDLLKAENKPLIDLGFFRKNVKFPLDKFYVEIGLFNNNSDFLEWEDKYHDLYNKRVLAESRLHDGIADIIKQIHEAGISQSILSAREHESLQVDVAHFGLTKYFDAIKGSQPKTSYKGKLEYAKEILNPNANKKLLIGDTLHDYEIAEALGIDCLLVAKGINDYSLLSKSGAIVVDAHESILLSL